MLFPRKLNIERILRLSKEGGWIVAGQVTQIIGMLVLVRVITEYLNLVEYGELALGLTLALLLNTVITGGIANGIGRFYSIAVEKNKVYDFLKASSKLIIYATLIIG